MLSTLGFPFKIYIPSDVLQDENRGCWLVFMNTGNPPRNLVITGWTCCSIFAVVRQGNNEVLRALPE